MCKENNNKDNQNKEKLMNLRKQMLSSLISDNDMAVSTIFALCTYFCDEFDVEANDAMGEFLNNITDMCMSVQRSMRMLEFMEMIWSDTNANTETFECVSFIQRFSEKSADVLENLIKIETDTGGYERIWVKFSREIIEYAFLCFLRMAADKQIKKLTLSCTKTDKKITIKMLAEGNVYNADDPIGFAFDPNKAYMDMLITIISRMKDAECIVRDSELSIIVSETDMNGEIILKENSTERYNVFSPYHIMLDDVSDYRFF